MLTTDEPGYIDWRAVAAKYRERLHSDCLLGAFGAYIAAGVSIDNFMLWLRMDSVWREDMALLAWLPLGAVAWLFKGWLEDLADRGLPSP